MIRLGVSVYPEQETIEEIDQYLAMASKYGFTKIFTSLFSVPGTKEEVFNYFKNFIDIAHKYGMEVCGDANTDFLRKMGADEKNLAIFKEMGLDTLRMDSCYMDERDVTLINNDYGIRIELSAGFVPIIDQALANGANPENLSVCHNFYPERYTAPALKPIDEANSHWKEKGVKVAMFISSQVPGTHGPWPVSDGLPTLEDHRFLPVETQLKHMIALNNIDEVLFGNAFASEEEFKAIDRVMKETYIHIPPYSKEEMGMLAMYLPHGDLTRMMLKIHLDETISEKEKDILFNTPIHSVAGDGVYYMLRSRWTRITRKGESIPVRPCNQTHYKRGDVVIVNDNLAHYRAEVQIVLKDIPVDGQRNLLGHIDESEMIIIDELERERVTNFAFEKE